MLKNIQRQYLRERAFLFVLVRLLCIKCDEIHGVFSQGDFTLFAFGVRPMLTDKTGIIISNTQNVCSNYKSYSSWHFLFPNYVACTRSQFTCSHAPCVCLSGGNPRILSTKDIMLDSLRHFQKTCNLLETKISVNKFEKMTNFKANHLYFSNIKNMKFEIKG